MQNLIARVAESYCYHKTIRGTAKECGLSPAVTRKLLITAGLYANDTSIAVSELRREGFTKDEICDMLKISPSAFNACTPYEKGSYLTDVKTSNAIRIQKCRDKKQKK